MASKIFVLEKCVWYFLIFGYVILFYFGYREWFVRHNPYPIFDIFPDELNMSATLDKKPLNLIVYYSSFSTESKNFILNQLFPTMDELSSSINLTMVPYGDTEIHAADGQMKLICKNGNFECLSNTYHGCMLDQAPKNGRMKAQLVGCLFERIETDGKQRVADKESIIDGARQCSSKYQFHLNFAAVQKCADGIDGVKLFFDNGLKTNKLKGSEFPIITINGHEFSKQVQRSLQTHLFSYLCQLLSNDPFGNKAAITICTKQTTEMG